MIGGVLNSLAARLKAATPRERAGMACVGAAVSAVLAMTGFDWSMRALERDRASRQSAAEERAAYTRASDERRHGAIAADINKVWRWSIVDASRPLAQAQAVAAVENLAAQAGLMNADIAALADSEAPGLVQMLEVRVSADFDWQGLLAMLDALETSEISFRVRSVAVTPNADQAPRLTLVLAAPYLQDAPT